MNTPIIKISDDQNEITHESGVVTVFEETNLLTCNFCCYLGSSSLFCRKIPCLFTGNGIKRNDKKSGIFKLKP